MHLRGDASLEHEAISALQADAKSHYPRSLSPLVKS